MLKYGVFSGPYSVRMRKNTEQKNLRIWTLFTQRSHTKVMCPSFNYNMLRNTVISVKEFPRNTSFFLFFQTLSVPI